MSASAGTSMSTVLHLTTSSGSPPSAPASAVSSEAPRTARPERHRLHGRIGDRRRAADDDRRFERHASLVAFLPVDGAVLEAAPHDAGLDRKSTRLNSSPGAVS